MARILGVGNATLDIINRVERYPAEDDEIRALDQAARLGGNTANTLSVLAQQGHACAWAGTLADEPDARLIRDGLARFGIDLGPVRTLAEGKVPTSYVVLSRATGSRTIVHHRDLPEYRFEDFARLPLAAFDWVHFEGRNLEQLKRMLAHLREHHPAVRCSLEVEKPRRGIEALLPYPDLVLFSRVYARARGFTTAERFLAAVRGQAPQADLVCGWGEAGAFGLRRDGQAVSAPAWRPERVVDTLGAGDVLNAGVIGALAGGSGLAQALVQAVELAGRKCGQEGLTRLGGSGGARRDSAQ